MRYSIILFASALVAVGSPALAHKLIKAQPTKEIARDSFSAVPSIEWNRLSEKEGKYQEIWTLDGDSLNKVTFFGGVPVGEPLFREEDKKREPLPKVSAGMLITDIPAILENSYRTQGRASRMTIGEQEPAKLNGHSGIKFSYSYVFADDEVERRGEALGAVIDGKLYLVTYEAPSLYFFDKDLNNFRQLLQTLKING
jgi:hypothetical protein